MIGLNQLKKYFLPRGLMPRTVRGGRLKGLRCELDLTQSTQTWRGIYERCLQDWLVEHVHEGATCVDVGASDGYFTLLIAKLAGPTGTVFAFEPGNDASKISRNFNLNPRVPLAKLEVFQTFVAAEPSEKSVSIDVLFEHRGITNLDIVKIDVDGAEVDVLRGMINTLGRFHPHLFIEVHSRELLEKIAIMTRELGYKMTLEYPPAYEHRPIEFNVFYFSS